jgi:hypothetical protein
VGVDQIAARMALPAVNALTHGAALGDLIASTLPRARQQERL